MKLSVQLLLIFYFALSTLIDSYSYGSSSETDPLLVSATLNPVSWSPGQGGELELDLKLPAQFHVYEESVKLRILEPDGFQISQPKITPVIEWFDKFSKKNRRGFKDKAKLKVHLEAPAQFSNAVAKIKFELTYQACSDQFCLFPVKKEILSPIELIGALEKKAATTITTDKITFFSTENLTQYLGQSLFLSLFFIFLAGIITSFTPCIFPMIPITLAVLGNHSEERTRIQNFVMSIFYVLGIATTYSSLGLIAASSGSLFGASLGNPYVLSIMCLIFFTMSLSMYGLFEIQVPAFIRNKFGAGKNKGGLSGAYFTGLFAGIVASPCVGPVLVAILTFVATSQSKVLGFLYLFTYALGLGMIFIILGLSNQLVRFLPRSGLWMNAFKFFLGTLMLSAFYYYLNLLVSERLFDFALSIGLIVIASIYGAFLPSKEKTPIQHLRKGLMQAVLFIGFGYLALGTFDLRPFLHQQFIGGAKINELKKMNWQEYSEKALTDAIENKKPVLIDFWAEWCAACHELEEHTFSNKRVQALAENYILLKFDATTDSTLMKELKKKYNIQGLPTVIFINPQGKWNQKLTLTAFEKAEPFLIRMEENLKN